MNEVKSGGFAIDIGKNVTLNLHNAPSLAGISSMATRLLLLELSRDFERMSGSKVHFESVGGVEAARRVTTGEAFDVVLLASDAIDKLIATGHVMSDSRTDIVCSPVVIAAKQLATLRRIDSVETMREAVLAAAGIGYSTGPSGTELLQLFDKWGILPQLQDRLVQAAVGKPVGQMVADGVVELGFQQFSEMMHFPGVFACPLPAKCAIISRFTAGICSTSRVPESARDLIAYLASGASAESKNRYGMQPA